MTGAPAGTTVRGVVQGDPGLQATLKPDLFDFQLDLEALGIDIDDE
jgi:hypothetical protein